MSPLIAGGLIGFGQATQKVSADWTAERLEGLRQENANRRQQALLDAAAMRQDAGFKHDRDMVPLQSAARLQERRDTALLDNSPEIVEAKANAANRVSELTLPARIAEKQKLGEADTQIELDRFEKLAPAKRKEEIDSAVEVLKAQSTPEMLAATRRIAQAKHIVDPSFTAVPQADGTVMMINARNPSAPGVLLKGEDGKPVVKRDSEEMRAATSIINMANTNLRIAQAEHKATLADSMAEPATKAAADAAWKAAQEEATRLTAPAFAVLYSKAKISEGGAPSTPGAPASSGAQWNSSTGQVVLDGQEIGRAKTRDQANSMIAKARSSTGDSAGRPSLSSFSGTSGGATRDDPLQIRDPFKPAGGILGSHVPELVTPTKAEAPKARAQQARDELVNRQAEAEKDRVADTFRSIIQVGRFQSEDRWLIESALQTGKLNEAETSTARQMLDQLRK